MASSSRNGGEAVCIHQIWYDSTIHRRIFLTPGINSLDRVIQKKKRDYSDPNSSTNMKKLNDDLQSIHNIMRKTIDDVLDRYLSLVCASYVNFFSFLQRGNKLDEVSEISKNLASESKKYKWGAKQLSTMVRTCHYTLQFLLLSQFPRHC